MSENGINIVIALIGFGGVAAGAVLAFYSKIREFRIQSVLKSQEQSSAMSAEILTAVAKNNEKMNSLVSCIRNTTTKQADFKYSVGDSSKNLVILPDVIAELNTIIVQVAETECLTALLEFSDTNKVLRIWRGTIEEIAVLLKGDIASYELVAILQKKLHHLQQALRKTVTLISLNNELKFLYAFHPWPSLSRHRSIKIINDWTRIYMDQLSDEQGKANSVWHKYGKHLLEKSRANEVKSYIRGRCLNENGGYSTEDLEDEVLGAYIQLNSREL